MDNHEIAELLSATVNETIKIGDVMGRNLRGGEVIELISDVGGGKTTFVKGVAVGAGSSDLVSSPSFTLCNEYKCEKFTIYHFDFYRLKEPGIIKQELNEVLYDDKAVVLIEWPDTIEDILPLDKIVIEISSADETKRQIKLIYDQDHGYIARDLT